MACEAELLRQPAPVTRRVILQKARCHPSRKRGSNCLRALWFQVLFHSPPGVLFTVPSRYWFAIGGSRYLALGGGPPGFPLASSWPVVLGDSSRRPAFFLRDSHPLGWNLPVRFGKNPAPRVERPTTPPRQTRRFRLEPVRSPLLGLSRLLSVPAGT